MPNTVCSVQVVPVEEGCIGGMGQGKGRDRWIRPRRGAGLAALVRAIVCPPSQPRAAVMDSLGRVPLI